MTRVKICGISDLKTAEVAVEAGADFIGLIFAPSPRQVSPEEASEIVKVIHNRGGRQGRVQINASEVNDDQPEKRLGLWKKLLEENLEKFKPLVVGVFADQPIEFINEVTQSVGLDLVQLSGHEEKNYFDKLEIPAIEVVHIFPQTTTQDIVNHMSQNKAAGLLLDTATTKLKGGTGKTFDWEIATKINSQIPLLLAGGLTEKNVSEAIKTVLPWAVDVSSGVEKDGKKDHPTIKKFIQAAKGVASEPQ